MMTTDPLKSCHPPQPAARYRFGAIAFHWAMFALVVMVGVLGLFGISLWLVLLARFCYRLRHSLAARAIVVSFRPVALG